MKNMLICSLMAFSMITCATATKKPLLDPYSQITVENVKKCEPAESWRVMPMGLPGIVLLFKDCLKINQLVVISVDDEEYTEKIRNESVDLLAEHFIYFLDHKKDSHEKDASKDSTPVVLKWTLRKIKREVNFGFETYFYILSSKKIKTECNGPTCSREKH